MPTDICAWVSDQGGPTGITVTNVFEIVDSYLLSTPPVNYTFIPTLENVFGIVDYHLGLDGDPLTGCSLFAPPETLFERFTEVGELSEAYFYGNVWRTMTFTIGTTSPNETHMLTSVSLPLTRMNYPGIITVSIRATSNGKPTGEDLAIGTTDGNTLPMSGQGMVEFRNIPLTEATMVAGTKYAIVVRCSAPTCLWIGNIDNPTYPGGSYGYTIDGGASWVMGTSVDFLFEEYGISE